MITSKTQAKPISGFMLAAGFNKNKIPVVVVKYGRKSDQIVAFVQDKPSTISDIALAFGWSKTATSSLIHKIKRTHKVIKLDLQVINGRSVTVIRGINLTAEYKADDNPKNIPIICGGTDVISRQKQILKMINLGLNTSKKIFEKIDICMAYLLRYLKRLFIDGNASRSRINDNQEFIYSITEKGLIFMGGNHE